MPIPAPFRTAAVLGCLIGGLAASPAAAADGASPFSSAEKTAIEQVVRDYLLENPDLILEVLTILQERQDQADRAQQADRVQALSAQIFDSASSPVIGNPDGDLTLVEFFDYQCGYCKSMLEPLQDMMTADGRIRVIMKEFPILGPASVTAARAALASARQGKYAEFHRQLMSRRGGLNDAAIFKVAEEVGLDLERLKADMSSDAVSTEIAANLRLAQQLGINGTPSFVVGNEILPGAVDIEVIRGRLAAQPGKG